MKKISAEMQVGLFALGALILLVYMTVKVSEGGLFQGGAYSVGVVIESAEGLTKKTPVEVAGIQVGFIEDIHLYEGHRAKAQLRLNREVKLGQDARAQVRTKGFLGETYIELIPGNTEAGMIGNHGEIQATNPYVDLGQIASDVREITSSVKKLLAEDGQGPVTRVLKNMEVFTAKLSELTVQNQQGINDIVANLKQFSTDLSQVMADRKESLKDTMERIHNITRKIDEGRGTVGRLINDDDIATNLNDAAKGVSETLGGVNRFQIELGFHLEYLTKTKDFKNYASIVLKPRPDKYFLLELVVDPSPSPVRTLTTTEITTGGATATVSTDTRTVEKNHFLISAELAKTFYNFTLRGGLIESRGGVGLDYNFGPLDLQFSAFDFRSDIQQRPHLKLMGSLNVTSNFYVVSGLDDFISRQQKWDWFVGAGFRLVDNDVRSLLGAANLR